MRTCRLVMFSFMLLSSVALSSPAQNRSDFDIVLFPLRVNSPSTYGAVWNTRLSVFSETEFVRIKSPLGACVFECIDEFPAVPGVEVQLPVPFRSSSRPGLIVLVEKGKSDRLKFSAVLRNIGKVPPSLTEAPVVRERDVSQTSIHLLGIARDPAYRHNLRIYDIDSKVGAMVRVRFFRSPSFLLEGPSPPLAEVDVMLDVGDGHYSTPGYAMLDRVLEQLNLLAAGELLRVEVQSLTPGLRFWAFMTLVNPMTQEATIITPQ